MDEKPSLKMTPCYKFSGLSQGPTVIFSSPGPTWVWVFIPTFAKYKHPQDLFLPADPLGTSEHCSIYGFNTFSPKKSRCFSNHSRTNIFLTTLWGRRGWNCFVQTIMKLKWKIEQYWKPSAHVAADGQSYHHGTCWKSDRSRKETQRTGRMRETSPSHVNSLGFKRKFGYTNQRNRYGSRRR